MKKDRLLKVAEILEDVKPSLFDIRGWIDYDENKPCRTSACAMGWAAQHPWFRARGLYVTRDGLPYFRSDGGTDAASSFFEITKLQAYYLFMPEGYSGGGNPSVRRVIKRIRKFVETNGKINWRETGDRDWFREFQEY